MNHPSEKHAGWMQVEMLVGLALLILAVFPLAGTMLRDRHFCAHAHVHAVALQVVDGELEALAAGGWLAFEQGTHRIESPLKSAAYLPPGELRLCVEEDRLRLAWIPEVPRAGPRVVRERAIP